MKSLDDEQNFGGPRVGESESGRSGGTQKPTRETKGTKQMTDS